MFEAGPRTRARWTDLSGRAFVCQFLGPVEVGAEEKILSVAIRVAAAWILAALAQSVGDIRFGTSS